MRAKGQRINGSWSRAARVVGLDETDVTELVRVDAETSEGPLGVTAPSPRWRRRDRGALPLGTLVAVGRRAVPIAVISLCEADMGVLRGPAAVHWAGSFAAYVEFATEGEALWFLALPSGSLVPFISTGLRCGSRRAD
jgi:hypothetical protein